MPGSRARAWSSIVVVSLLLFTDARPASAGPPKEDASTSAARDLYKSATKHYQLGEYREALGDYKEAFRLKEDASFLFNIAQCHRQLGAHDEAARAYRAYLRARPEAPNRVDVEAFIAGEDKAIEEERVRAAAAEELRRKELDVKLADANNAAPWHSDTVGWVLVAGGFALTAGGAAAIAYGSTIKFPANMPALSNELHNRQTISWAVGAVAMGAGLGMLTGGIVRFVGRARRQRAASARVSGVPGVSGVSIAPALDGATLVVGGSW